LFFGRFQGWMESFKVIRGFLVELPEEGVFETVPELFAGAQHVGDGEEGEEAELFEVFDDGCEVCGNVGVAEVAALGDAGHVEVVADEVTKLAGGRFIQSHAACDVGGETGSFFSVVGGFDGFACVVEE